jgi:hypothetical protein
MSAEVTRGSRRTQDSAIWASVWPRDLAISFSARTCASVTSPIWSDDSEPFRLAREPAGTPPRYFPVRTPWASGENAMQPTPSRPSTSSSPPSIQRFSIEYDGWWISSRMPI